ncbi:hypothetical protein C4J81_17455 [Deltaproteobacteria bacterium Smac51]|nr:hypothetical protein C4J81_17455 [Deltaproteobacteria bacterium Smac51]
MNNDLYPLTLEPVISEQWGHSESSIYDEEGPREFTQGLIRLAADNSRVAAGPMAGRTLGHLKQLWGADLVGANAADDPDAPFPLEMKMRRTGGSALAVGLDGVSLWFFLKAGDKSTLNAGFEAGLNLKAAAAEAGGDPGRWADYMPEYEAAGKTCLLLPPFSPLLLGAGLDVLQIGPPAAPLPVWPLDGGDGGSISRAAESDPPRWLAYESLGGGMEQVFDSENLTVTLVTTSLMRGVLSQDASTVIWPLEGQGRLRTQGPAPATRIQPGRAVVIPAGLGRYTIESGAEISCLIIEAA